ncbi:UDP-glucosyltransferase 2-like [Uranotaenia lowii]|uniref:UDP-glucosyltransferase 2-like n=1 Tax=Uranotaenia lowii TaxID=190385 RepID=UPI002478E0A7|nr:UDP-glucosyltransferase 2-like [Uranotaenia lowii]
MLRFFFTVFAISISICNGANILYIDGIPSPSHFIWHRSLIYGLAAKGHNVTALSVDVEKNPPPNVHFIHVEGVYEMLHEDGHETTDYFEMSKYSTIEMLNMFNDYSLAGCEVSLKSKGLKQLLDYPDDFKFDVVIDDFLQGPCMSAVARHKFKRPPFIAATGFHGLSITTSLTGAYVYPGMTPNHEFDAPEEMSYVQRFKNFFISHYEELARSHHLIPATDKIVREQFPELPYVGEFEKDTQIVLLNSNPVIQYSEPSMPNLISVGGMQIKSPKELPANLKEVVDNAKNGAILFSLGSNVRSDLLGNRRIIAILNAMAQFPKYQFLWKFESDSMPIEIPKNVLIQKWMPQNDLLAHPNLKLFITHSGLLSTQETVWHGVPIIGFPVFADQNRNINYCVKQGVGIRLAIETVTTDVLVDAIRKVTTDKSYRENMQRLSKLFRDQPEHPLDRAIWWVEWVLRNPDTRILQSNAMSLSWCVKYSFDVIIPLVLVVVAIAKLTIHLVTSVLCKKSDNRKHKRE